MAIGTMGVKGGGGLEPPNFKGRGADSSPPKKMILSLEVNTRFDSLQSYICLNPMIIVKH